MTIDHESVPKPGGPLATTPRAVTELLDRPTVKASPLSVPVFGRHLRVLPVPLFPASLLLADAFAVGAATLLVDCGHRPLVDAAVLITILVPINLAGGLYRAKLTLSVLDELPALAARAACAVAFAVTLGACAPARWAAGGQAGPPRLLALFTALLLLAGLGRAFGYQVLREVRRYRPRPALVLGAGHLGQRVAAALRQRPEYGLRPIGYLDPDPVLLPEDDPLPVLGGSEVLEREVRRHRIRQVIATEGAATASETAAALRLAARLGCQVWLVPALREYGAVDARSGDQLWGFPCLRIGSPAMRRRGWMVKRGLDIAVSGTGLLLLSPVLAACALAVRLDTGPGVLFRQQRTGLDGRVFTVLKFRTLRPSNEHESATRWNIAQDHRVGAIGRFLRRTSLDELPQLWNILRGDMTLVGPRPERPYFVLRFSQAYPEYPDRHRVPVGLTGLAQVNGLRGDTSIEDRARFDNRYIESWSLWQDVKLLLRTAALMLRPDGS